MTLRQKILIFIITSIFTFPCISTGEEKAGIYTLEKSIEEALSGNWGVKAKEEKIVEAEHLKEQAKADFYPKFSTTYGYTRLSEVSRSSDAMLPLFTGAGIPTGTFAFMPGREMNTQDNFQWKGTVSQPLFTGYALSSAYELAKLGIDQRKMELELERLDLALKVKESYFNILTADKSIFVAEDAVKSLESHVRVARNFYNVGMIPINDLLKAEVELANARYELIRTQNASKLARSAFNVLLAKPINDDVVIEDILYFKSVSIDFKESLDKAIAQRPEIKAMEINDMQIDEQIRLAKSKYYPNVALTYDYIKAGDDMDVSGSRFHDGNNWQITAGLSWTFWEWGKKSSMVGEKESLKRQLAQTRKAVEDGISMELKQAVLDLDQAEKNIPATKKAVEQAEENLRVSQERYNAQVTTSTEVLDAQTLLSRARINYYRALYDHNLAKAGLLRAIGEY
ncbi:MAG: TolC family protein [Deltaproteobacteria bacterium]|nr:TolC family protein [Deltaproteobacteria bacterium]